MSINDELRLQKKRKMYRSHHHLNFGPVKVAKSRKVFFIFDPIQVGLVGLVGLVGPSLLFFWMWPERENTFRDLASFILFRSIKKSIDDWHLKPVTHLLTVQKKRNMFSAWTVIIQNDEVKVAKPQEVF